MGEVRTLGRYEVIKHLASGGMAQVLLARAKGIENFERYVVIKQIHVERANDKNVVKMFVEEARLAASLHHANIVQVHDIGQENGEYFFAMEYVHGEDLRALLTKLSSKGEMMSLAHVLTIVTAAAAALHHAHERRGPDRELLGLVHRDVSPANILVGYDGNVKVVDFGIAKATYRSVETHSGTLKGKISYMSPEQCMGLQADRRSDVFSLGIVLFELVTVRRLFKAQSDYLTMGTIVAGNVPRPSAYREDLPPELERIMMRALETDPNARYQTAEDMRMALELFAANTNIRTSPTALGDYMVAQFGTRPEPWLVDDEPEPITAVDFDGSQPGAADVEAPTGLTPAAGSPLARAAEKKHRIRPATPHEGWDSDDEKPTTMSGTPMAWTTRRIPPPPLPTKKSRGLRTILLLGSVFAVVVVITWQIWPTSGSKSEPAAASAPVNDPTPVAAPDPAPASDPAPAAAPDPAPVPAPIAPDPATPAPAAAPTPSASPFLAAEPTVPTVPTVQDPVPKTISATEPPEPLAKSKPTTKPTSKKAEKPAPSKKTRVSAKPAPAKDSSPAVPEPEYDPDSLFIKKKP